MTQQTELEHLYELVDQLEANLDALKDALNAYSRPNGKRLPTRKRGPTGSLYGIFPSTDVTFEDFREARESWSHKPEQS
jgi:hypothetical protein